MTNTTFKVGDTVVINGWGLNGAHLKVSGFDGLYYALDFENGNRVPGYYHGALLKPETLHAHARMFGA